MSNELKEACLKKGLTLREYEVASLVVKGLTNREVSNQLFVTEATVKFHLTNVFKKTKRPSRLQLTAWFTSLPEYKVVSIV